MKSMGETGVQQYRVVIVGSGAAGFSAVDRLAKFGV